MLHMLKAVRNALAVSTIISGTYARCHPPSTFLDWKAFKGNGANLGGWLVQEPFIDTDFWTTNCGSAVEDEWTCCANLGAQCGPILEDRYANWITPADIDVLATGNVSVLRIPTTYAAWIDLPASELYHGKQREHLTKIANYAIETHGMHIIIDLHGLPGGINNSTTGERIGGLDWWYNQTALDWSMKAVDAVLEFIQTSAHPWSYTLEPINEPLDVPDLIGQADSLTDEAAVWLLKYFNAVIERAAAADPRIPVMLQGAFRTEEYWSANFSADANIVFDVHYYYFNGRPTGPANVTDFICGDAKEAQGDGVFPVFTGEWSIQTLYDNTLEDRSAILSAGLSAFGRYTQGSSYWTGKMTGNASVDGEGVQSDYWSYIDLIELGLGSHLIDGFCE